VFGGRHDCENDYDSEHNRKCCKDKTWDHDARSDLSPPFLIRAIPTEIRPVKGVKAPFDHFNDGNSYSDGESKKQNKLDDHFSDP
jgi:hypothetical protein